MRRRHLSNQQAVRHHLARVRVGREEYARQLELHESAKTIRDTSAAAVASVLSGTEGSMSHFGGGEQEEDVVVLTSVTENLSVAVAHDAGRTTVFSPVPKSVATT